MTIIRIPLWLAERDSGITYVVNFIQTTVFCHPIVAPLFTGMP